MSTLNSSLDMLPSVSSLLCESVCMRLGPTAQRRLRFPLIANLLLAFPKEVRQLRDSCRVHVVQGRSMVMCRVIALEGWCGALISFRQITTLPRS